MKKSNSKIVKTALDNAYEYGRVSNGIYGTFVAPEDNRKFNELIADRDIVKAAGIDRLRAAFNSGQGVIN